MEILPAPFNQMQSPTRAEKTHRFPIRNELKTLSIPFFISIWYNPSMITGIDILTGVLGNKAYDIIKGAFSSFRNSHLEQDEVINIACKAIDRAYEKFLERYAEKFPKGRRHDSFLARDENVRKLLQRVFPHNETPQYETLNPEGFNGFHTASEEEVEYLIQLVIGEFKADRQLAEILSDNKQRETVSKIFRDTETIKDDVKQIKSAVAAQADRERHEAETGYGILLTPMPPMKADLVGRKKDLNALEKKLKKSSRVLLVNGIGGIGKTEVCKTFFKTHYQSFRYAAWVDYFKSVKESLVQVFDRPSSRLLPPEALGTGSLDERFEMVMTALNSLPSDSSADGG